MEDSRRNYGKSLGIFELVSLDLGGTIVSGIFIVPGIAAAVSGPSSIIAWIVASLSASCVMYSLAKTSCRYPSTGAFYSIFSKAFGKNIIICLYVPCIICVWYCSNSIWSRTLLFSSHFEELASILSMFKIGIISDLIRLAILVVIGPILITIH
jgi:amino acid transporter